MIGRRALLQMTRRPESSKHLRCCLPCRCTNGYMAKAGDASHRIAHTFFFLLCACWVQPSEERESQRTSNRKAVFDRPNLDRAVSTAMIETVVAKYSRDLVAGVCEVGLGLYASRRVSRTKKRASSWSEARSTCVFAFVHILYMHLYVCFPFSWSLVVPG